MSPALTPGPPATVHLEPLRAGDAQRCAELESELFAGDDPWNARAFLDALAAGHHYVAAREHDRLVGYAGLARTGDEAEVHTIAVDPAHRGRGIGRALLAALLDAVAEATVFLEVRTDNDAAIALYRSAGFIPVGIRRRYYQPSGADAFTMRRSRPGGLRGPGG